VRCLCTVLREIVNAWANSLIGVRGLPGYCGTIARPTPLLDVWVVLHR